MQLCDTHVHHVEATFDLLDPGNLLYHPRYLVLADRARGCVLEALRFAPHQLWAGGFAFVVAEISARYLLPVCGGTKLAILTQMPLRSSRTLQVTQRFVVCEDLDRTLPNGAFIDRSAMPAGVLVVCELALKLVCVNVTQRCVAKIPEGLATALHAVYPNQTVRQPSSMHLEAAS